MSAPPVSNNELQSHNLCQKKKCIHLSFPKRWAEKLLKLSVKWRINTFPATRRRYFSYKSLLIRETKDQRLLLVLPVEKFA